MAEGCQCKKSVFFLQLSQINFASFSKNNYALICFRFSFCKVSDFFRFINGKGVVDKTLVTVSE